MMKFILKLTLSLIILTLNFAIFSCSSTKNLPKQQESIEIKKEDEGRKPTFEIINYQKAIDSYECSGDIELNFNDQRFSGSFELQTIRNQVFMLKLFGPFGINVATVYGVNDNIIIMNNWNNNYYQSLSGFDGFEFLVPYPDKFFKIFLAESFLSHDTLIKTTNDTLTISKDLNNSYKYSFIYSLKSNSILKSKIADSSYEYNVFYEKFENINNSYLPKSIILKENRMNGKIKISIDKFKNINNIKKVQSPNYKKFEKVDNLNDLFK